MTLKITIPDVPALSVPPELDGDPAITECRRLVTEFHNAAADLRKLVAGEASAAEADRNALAEAMAAGKSDPGDKRLIALAQGVEAGQRRVNGLADAALRALAGVTDLVTTNAPEYLATAADDHRAAADRVDALIEQLSDVLDEVDRVHRFRKWVERVTDPTWVLLPGSGLPSLSGATRPVQIGSSPLTRVDVLASIRRSVES